MYRNVRKNKAPQQIIHQIRGSILEGSLKPGDRLASESELMADFGVSKATLREALRALEYLNLIEIRKGSGGGTFVAEADMDITKESLMNFLHFKNVSITHVYAIRRNLEPYAASVAARKIKEEDLARLEKLIELYRNNISKRDSDSLRKIGSEFHRVIVNVTQNPILISILDFIGNITEDVKRIPKSNTEFSKKVVESHESIYQALKARDPKRAEREMLDDIIHMEKGLMLLSENKL